VTHKIDENSRLEMAASRGVVPFLRVADAEASAEWYARLGFEIEWRHRFEPGLPLFVAISRDGARIFLSEHTGDARPDTLLYLYVDDVDAVGTGFGVDPVDAPYGMREIELRDPDGNRLRLGTRLPG
jgi:catechol 2,3-dioxygenase-like lactoylglutathione lyase family enzyme